ncbi:MAG: L-serine ammonia-lyase, iron-sulfur-dependent, subunit alpha [Bacteroides sp.]|nr:L-serine ammonia-lyase, iron-sulfur-dependent, subunit alpha [Bacteroides sp.]
MTQMERQIIDLVKREVVPAIGCTEPIAVALCVAKATELLEKQPERIDVWLSANVLKNAMGVGIPGTGMIGLPIAIALGALIGKSAYALEVLKDCTPASVEAGKRYIEELRIEVSLKKDCFSRLYIETWVSAGSETARAVIAGGHTEFVRLCRNDQVLLDKELTTCMATEEETPGLTLRAVYDFAGTAPLEEIRFIGESARLNKEAAEHSFGKEYGHCLGRILSQTPRQHLMGEGPLSRILAYTSAACDARMAGAMVPVMSNSGSGNQGIAATLPVVIYAEENRCDEEQLLRALMLSHLTVIYIKQSLGRLSALCGCVVAATGSACGITLLMGGAYREVTYAVQNMIANLTGMICDGAKPSCSLKVTTGVSTAVLSAVMAMEGCCVSCVEGIIEEDVDRSIRNLTRIGSEAMDETDRMVLEMMTNKERYGRAR